MYAPRQLAYAPTPYSYTPSSNLTATINLDQEVKLADNAQERNLYESLAEIYSIIITLDALEKAYLRDSIKETEYTETCDRLLRQYKSNLADDTVAAAFGDLERFKMEWDLEVPKATERLRIGLPATVETAPAISHRPTSTAGPTTATVGAQHLIAASENFVTLFDAISMSMLSKDTLHPILVEIIQAVNKVTDKDFENKGKIVQWLITLNQMRAAEELTAEQARELRFDLESAYDGFKGTTWIWGWRTRRRWMLRADASLVLDLPQLYTHPSAKTLLATLQDLSSAPPSWDTTPRTGTPRSVSGASTPLRKRRMIRSEGVPSYLTKIISSSLAWIEDDAEKEQIWEVASVRLSERSGRTAMGAISRTFVIPMNHALAEMTDESRSSEHETVVESNEDLQITLHEPALTADNLGLKTWASSYLLAKRMALLKDTIPALPSDANILELGAGTGLVGLTAAALLHRHVILTDLPAIVPNLENNATANATLIASHGGSVSTAILDWSSPSTFFLPTNTNTPDQTCPPNTFPLILTADPIYSPEHPRLLVDAVAYHLSRSSQARVMVEMPVREAYGEERRVFRERMGEMGLMVCGEGEELGLDDWGGVDAEGVEVRCWWSVWGWSRGTSEG
ncbi:VPS28-domain-containing protein [Teratosphaeria destructans]|uniref:VPS28-domain-containing protein n=1 Tax=Teratosphaeria destructans TaxID=418781 RepID=A0A9W7SVD3_9PEZI|nr:VPS28-domain-containing protein [Teratosphaeria destructans]